MATLPLFLFGSRAATHAGSLGPESWVNCTCGAGNRQKALHLIRKSITTQSIPVVAHVNT